MSTDKTKLRVELEASTAKFVAAMRHAQKTGVITATELETVLARANASVANQSRKAAAGMTGLMNVSRQGRFVIQNTANQIGDIAVQLEGGTNAMKVMGQQLPQILGGFGALGGALGIVGPLLGTVAAIGLPVAAVMLAQRDSAAGAAKEVDEFTKQLQKASSALKNAEAAAYRAGTGGLEDLKKTYGEITDEVVALADRLAAIELSNSNRQLKALTKGLDTQQLADQLEKLETGSDFAIAKIALDVPQEEVDRVRKLVDQLTEALQVRPDDSGLENSLRLAREQLALYSGDLKNAGALAANVKFDNESLLRTVALTKQIPEAISKDRFSEASAMMSELLTLMESLGVETESGFGAEVVRIEDALRQHARLLGDAETQAEGVASAASGIVGEISDANAEALALVGNLRAAMLELSRVTSGIAAAQRKALAETRIKQQTIGQPVERAGQLARSDYNEQSGAAAYAMIRSGNVSRLDELAASADEIEQGARDVAAAEESLRAAEKTYAEQMRGGSKRKGGKKSKGSIFDVGETELAKVHRQIEMIGKTRSEVAALTLKYRLLDEAKKRGLNLDKALNASGETLRQGIEAQAQKIGDLVEEYEIANAKLDGLTSISDRLEDTLVDTFDGATDSVKEFGKWLKKAAIQYALFGKGPLAGVFGGGASGGGFNGLLGGLFGGLFGGFREGGGPVSAGKAYVVGEKRPELFVPKTGGTIIPQVPQGGVSVVHVTVSVDDNGNLQAFVDQTARHRAGQAGAGVLRKTRTDLRANMHDAELRGR